MINFGCVCSFEFRCAEAAPRLEWKSVDARVTISVRSVWMAAFSVKQTQPKSRPDSSSTVLSAREKRFEPVSIISRTATSTWLSSRTLWQSMGCWSVTMWSIWSWRISWSAVWTRTNGILHRLAEGSRTSVSALWTSKFQLQSFQSGWASLEIRSKILWISFEFSSCPLGELIASSVSLSSQDQKWTSRSEDGNWAISPAYQRFQCWSSSDWSKGIRSSDRNWATFGWSRSAIWSTLRSVVVTSRRTSMIFISGDAASSPWILCRPPSWCWRENGQTNLVKKLAKRTIESRRTNRNRATGCRPSRSCWTWPEEACWCCPVRRGTSGSTKYVQSTSSSEDWRSPTVSCPNSSNQATACSTTRSAVFWS